jgi:hypothetical protein
MGRGGFCSAITLQPMPGWQGVPRTRGRSRSSRLEAARRGEWGCRNLDPEARSYLRGKRYNLEKRQDGGHGDQKSAPENQGPTTAQRLGDQYGVSRDTIERDGAFAEAVDTLEQQVRQDLRGQRYNREKTAGHGQSGDQNDTQTTAQRLGWQPEHHQCPQPGR